MKLDPFVLLLKAHGFALPETEVVFAPPRKWRADYLFRDQHVIIEREGGLFSHNVQAQLSHASPTHILRDMEKSNAAQLLGYTYLRYTPQQLDTGACLEELRPLLK